MTITKNRMYGQVCTALGAYTDRHNVDAIVAELYAVYGPIDIDDIESADFWAIVGRNETPADWCFTFGVGHPLFSRRYVVIRGTHDGAREIMFSVFDRAWSSQYSRTEFAERPELRGLTPLN